MQVRELNVAYTCKYTIKGHPFYFGNNLAKCWPNFTYLAEMRLRKFATYLFHAVHHVYLV